MNNEIVRINNLNLIVKEYKGQRVVTFKDIDTLHERAEKTAGRNFNSNKKRFIENVDYFHIPYQELRSTNFVEQANPKGLIVLTQTGYSMLVKSFEDDLAWEVQRELVNGYFNCKEINTKTEIMNTEMPVEAKREQIQIQADFLKVAIDVLKPTQSETLKMLKKFYESLGIEAPYLPNEVAEVEGFAVTELLTRYDVGMCAKTFNILMVKKGYMKEALRIANNGSKKYYKVLINKGLEYGKNSICIGGTIKQTFPLYYEEKFLDLLNDLGVTVNVR